MSDHAEENPREIIEEIRSSFLVDVSDLPAKHRAGAVNLQGQLNRALALLAADLYSKKSHFVLELVQNADDNAYRVGVTPELAFELTQSRLTLINNEIGFNKANVVAICNVGASSKATSKDRHIGEKGIGFKAVFSVSDSPEIHSNGYHFRFDRSDPKNLLGYVVPQWISPPADLRPGFTTIVLPAVAGVPFAPSALAELDSRVLLFLNKLRKLTLTVDGSRYVYSREDTGCVSRLITETRTPKSSTTRELHHYLRTSTSLDISAPNQDEKRPGIESSTIVLALPLDEEGRAKPEPGCHLFAFLPVKQFGFKFPIQADFILSSSREAILEERPWNICLRDGIASAFAGALPHFQATTRLGYTYLRFIPAANEVADPFFAEVRGGILSALRDLESLPCASGSWKRPAELRLADTAFRDLFPSALAIEVFGFDYVDQQVEGGAALLHELGVQDAAPTVALAIFGTHGTWLDAQPLEWRARFYAYIADRPLSFTQAVLADLPCLPVEGRSCVVPSKATVFFPLGKGKKYGFEAELTFIDSALYDAAAQLSGNVPKLFSLLQVRTDEPYDLLVGHILPLHKEDRWKSSGFTALIGHLRYVKDKLPRYLEGALGHGKSQAQAFQLLSDGVRIGTKKKSSESWSFRVAGHLYLGEEFQPDFCIETLAPGVLDTSHFVSPDYMTNKAKASEAEAESWRDFFEKLGIHESPTLTTAGANWVASKEMQALLTSPLASTRKATLECIDENWPYYAGKLAYTVPFGRGRLTNEPTAFSVTLRGTVAPLVGRRRVVPLSESYYRTTELVGLLGEGLPYVDAVLSQPMLDACRITYRLTAATLIRRLAQLRDEGAGTTKLVQSIYRALETQFWKTDAPTIHRAFESEALIQVKGIHRGWFKLSEIAWRNNDSFIDSIFPPIQATYKDFQGFFNEQLGIPRDLPIEKWVSSLELLDKITDIKDRQLEALAIYKRANRELTRFRREGSVPEWIDTFKTEYVYINQRGEMVANDDYLFANDRPDLAALFADEGDLSFIAVPSNEVPSLSRLFDAADVNRLSDAVDIEVPDVDDAVIDDNLTRRVRDAVPYFARILYSRHPDAFDIALESRAIAMLWDTEVCEVQTPVNQIVSIGEFQRQAETEAAFTESGHILYLSNIRVRQDRIASLISEWLLGSNELAEAFARVLLDDGSGSIDDLFSIWGISELPPDLDAAIRQCTSIGSTTDQAEPPDATPVDRPPDADAPDDKPSAHQPTSVVAPAPPKIAATSPKASEEPPQPSKLAATATSPPGANQTPRSVPSPREFPTIHAPTTTASGSTGPSPHRYATPHPSGSYAEASGGFPRAPSAGPSNPFASKQAAAVHPANGQGARTPAAGGSATPSPAANAPSMHPSHRLAPEYQPKKGRLLSYVEGPGDPVDISDPAEAQKAAARDAVGRAAVDFFLATQATRWKSVQEMPHSNPGFDILATALTGEDEFIEVKGQSGAWTEEGIALTPTELLTAQRKGSRYWLCVVEFALDERQRQLHLVQNPFELVTQFRFDVGWKAAAVSMLSVPAIPEANNYIEMEGVGSGRILSVQGKGKFFNVRVVLRDGQQLTRPFNPAKMKLFKEPPWQE